MNTILMTFALVTSPLAGQTSVPADSSPANMSPGAPSSRTMDDRSDQGVAPTEDTRKYKSRVTTTRSETPQYAPDYPATLSDKNTLPSAESAAYSDDSRARVANERDPSVPSRVVHAGGTAAIVAGSVVGVGALLTGAVTAGLFIVSGMGLAYDLVRGKKVDSSLQLGWPGSSAAGPWHTQTLLAAFQVGVVTVALMGGVIALSVGGQILYVLSSAL